MKARVLAVILAVFLYNISPSQSVNVYGLMPSSNPNLDYVRLAELDALSGTIITIDSVKPVNAYGFGTSAFDSYHQTYSFIGVDPNQGFRFNSWGVMSDTMYAMPQVSVTINDLEHDMKSLEFYGLGSYAINAANGEYALRFMNIDQITGEVVELKKMPEARAFPIGSTTYGSNDGIYYANILDNNFESKIYAIDAVTGDTNYTVPLLLPTGVDFMNFEYNNQDDLIYGLLRDYLNSWYAIGSIDPATGSIVDTIYEINDLQYFVQGASVFHQMSQNYLLYYTDNDNNSKLLSVDVFNRSMTANPTVPGYLSDLQVDNYEYVMTAYHNTVNTEDKPVKKIDLQVYPNPASTFVNVVFDLNHDLPYCSLEVYDITMSTLLFQKSIDTKLETKVTINTESFPTGVYIISLVTSKESTTKLFVVK